MGPLNQNDLSSSKKENNKKTKSEIYRQSWRGNTAV